MHLIAFTFFLLSCCCSVATAQLFYGGEIISACDSRFRVISVLGKGSYGTVYRAIQAETENIVAIKAFNTKNSAGRKMYRNEEEAMEKVIGVPHTVQMICSKRRLRDPSVIIMEFCNEGDVKSKLQTLTEAEELKLWDQVAAGLKGIHEKGIIHQNIRPENLFLHNGELKIGDFGLATTKDKAKIPDQPWSGTRKYMPPERIFKPTEPFTEAVDLWAAGITFFEIFAKKHPFYTKGGISEFESNLENFEQKKTNVIKRDLDSKVAPIVYDLLHTTPASRSIILSNEVNNNAIAGLLNRNSEKRMSVNELYSTALCRGSSACLQSNGPLKKRLKRLKF